MKNYQAQVFSKALQAWRPISTYAEPRTLKQARTDCQWCQDNDKGRPKSRVRIVMLEEGETEQKAIWTS